MRKLLVVALTLVGLLVPAGVAAAQEKNVPYEHAIQMSWNGSDYYSVIDESYVGFPKIVPGAEKSRVLKVRNDGPTAGMLRVSIIGVGLDDPDRPDVHHNPKHADPDGSKSGKGDPYKGSGVQGNFYEDLRLVWSTSGVDAVDLYGESSASFVKLDEDQQQVGGSRLFLIPMDQGETVDVKVGFLFDENATSGNKANLGGVPRLARFKVLLEIDGNFPGDQLVLEKSVTFTDTNNNKLIDSKEPAHYTFKVLNVGSTAVSKLRISDPMLEAAKVKIVCDTTTLEPLEATMCRADDYKITKEDADRGYIDNVATALGKNPDGTTVTSNPDDAHLQAGLFEGEGGGTTPGEEYVSGGIDSGIPATHTASIIGVLAGIIVASGGTLLATRRNRDRDVSDREVV